MRRPKRSCATVTALCRLMAQSPFIPSSISRITSEGTPRIVEEIGATVTVDRWLTALSRVRTRTGRCLAGVFRRRRSVLPTTEFVFPLRLSFVTPTVALLHLYHPQALQVFL